MASEHLNAPRFVKFHSFDGTTSKAFLFLVTKEGENEELSGAVWCDDNENEAGLMEGWNARSRIGHGGPEANVSWSEFEEEV